MKTWKENNIFLKERITEAREMDYTLKNKEWEFGYDVLKIRHFKANSDKEAVLKIIKNMPCNAEVEQLATYEEDEGVELDPAWICEWIQDQGGLTDFELKNDTTGEIICEAAFLDEVSESNVNW